jgi:hypothetical protein
LRIGIRTGVDLKAQAQLLGPFKPDLKDEPWLSKLDCESCHMVELKASVVIQDTFYSYFTAFDEKPFEAVLVEGGIEFLFLKVCTVEPSSETTCKDKCCAPKETCNIITGDCKPRQPCSLSDPGIECCNDSDCPEAKCSSDEGFPGLCKCNEFSNCVFRECSLTDPGIECCNDSDCPDAKCSSDEGYGIVPGLCKCNESNNCVFRECSLTDPGIECCNDSDCPCITTSGANMNEIYAFCDSHSGTDKCCTDSSGVVDVGGYSFVCTGWSVAAQYTICRGSCKMFGSCGLLGYDSVGSIVVAPNACIGNSACEFVGRNSDISIGSGSCVGEAACASIGSDIHIISPGPTKPQVIIGEASCVGWTACWSIGQGSGLELPILTVVGDGSCVSRGESSCSGVGR